MAAGAGGKATAGMGEATAGTGGTTAGTGEATAGTGEATVGTRAVDAAELAARGGPVDSREATAASTVEYDQKIDQLMSKTNRDGDQKNLLDNLRVAT